MYRIILCLSIATTLQIIHARTFEEDLTLTLEQKAYLDKFKGLILATVNLPHEYMKEDIYLIRWLRARNYNVEDAKAMLIKNLAWRKENNLDSIQFEDWSYYETHFPYSLQGRDHEGKPILYLNIGNMDFRKEVISGKLERLMRYVDKGLDEANNLVRDMGHKYRNVSQGNLILNVQGFSLARHACIRCVPAILSVMNTYENYFPGLADKIFVLNLPIAAEPILMAARRLLHEDTNRALQVYGTNRNAYMDAITSSIDLSELPKDLGGSKLFNDLEADDY